MMSSELLSEYKENGYCIVAGVIENIDAIIDLFEIKYKSKFTDNVVLNRNLLKCFANEPLIRKIFILNKLLDLLKNIEIRHPIYTGPVVTHYTSFDITGGAYGLKMHQDWPSMATSDNGVISWMSLFDTNSSSHGISVVPGSHKYGCLPGVQTDIGYVVEEEFTKNSINLEIERGSFLLMHPWLVHATYVNPMVRHSEYKLSLSTRFDDLDCEQWAYRNFRNAYTVSVDRDMWISTSQ